MLILQLDRGQLRSSSCSAGAYSHAQGIFVVYDTTDRHSFDNVKWWLNEITKEYEGVKTILLIGNKCDLVCKREVSFEEGYALADDNGYEFAETSARNSINVENAFLMITIQLKMWSKLTIPKEQAYLRSYSKVPLGGHSVGAKNSETTIFSVFSPWLLGGWNHTSPLEVSPDAVKKVKTRTDDQSIQPSISVDKPFRVATPSLRSVLCRWNGIGFDISDSSYLYQVQKASVEDGTTNFNLSAIDWARWENLGVRFTNEILILNQSLPILVRVRVCKSTKPISEFRNSKLIKWSVWSSVALFDDSGSKVTASAFISTSDRTSISPATSSDELNQSSLHNEWMPHWQSDSQHPICQRCKILFSFIVWRHHCRRCGKCLCEQCCPQYLVEYVEVYGRMVRICLKCSEQIVWNAMLQNSRFTSRLPNEPNQLEQGLQDIRSMSGLEVTTVNWEQGATSIIHQGRWQGLAVAVKQYKPAFISLHGQHAGGNSRTTENSLDRCRADDNIYSSIVSQLSMEVYVYTVVKPCPYCITLYWPDCAISSTVNQISTKFIVTEIVGDGFTLLKILENKEDVKWRWKFCALSNISQFLEYIHDRRIVHYDLKAENCLVNNLISGSDCVVKVFDFNSCTLFGLKSFAEIDVLGRTLSHAPPEFIQFSLGDKRASIHIDGKYDVYSLGILMAEIIDGQLSYEDESAIRFTADFQRSVVKGGRPMIDITSLIHECGGDSSVADAFSKLMSDCWNPDPTYRPTAIVVTSRLTDILDMYDAIKRRNIIVQSPAPIPVTDPDWISTVNTQSLGTETEDCDVSKVDLGASPEITASPTWKETYLLRASRNSFSDVSTLAHTSTATITAVSVSQHSPQYIVVLKPKHFEPTLNILAPWKRLPPRSCEYESAIDGLKAYRIDDPDIDPRSVSAKYYCMSNIPNDVFQLKQVYRQHPRNPQKYVLLSDFPNVMKQEKRGEFIDIMRNLGAKRIEMTHFEHSRNQMELHGSVVAPALSSIGVNFNKMSTDRSRSGCLYEYKEPFRDKPFFEDRRYFFYDSEPEWQTIRNSRIPDAIADRALVTVDYSTQRWIKAKALVKLQQLGGVDAGLLKENEDRFSCSYEIRFYPREAYKEILLQNVAKWSTVIVQEFLDHLKLKEHKALFARLCFNGQSLISDTFIKTLLEASVPTEHLDMLVRAVAAEISGYGTFYR